MIRFNKVVISKEKKSGIPIHKLHTTLQRANFSLTCCIPKTQINWFAVHHDVRRIVIKPGKKLVSKGSQFNS